MKYLCYMLLFIVSCNSSFDLDKAWNEALDFRQKSKLQESITSLKKIIAFGKNESFSVKAQYQLADIYLNDVNDYTFAIQEFEELIDKHPQSEFTKKSIFMLGYINSNYIQAYDEAISYYNMFLEKYPEDDLVQSVQYELELLESSGIIDTLDKLRTKNQ